MSALFRRVSTHAIGLAVAVACMSRAAFAQPNPEERALADARFQEGRALMGQRRIDEACAKFEESERLFPRAGTSLNLAACREQQGRVASAWGAYTRALGLAQKEDRADRVELAKTKIAELSRDLSWLSIQVTPELEAAGAEVTRDGAPVGHGAWGVAVPVDAGRHVVSARVPGAAPIEVTVEVGPHGDRQIVTLPPSSGAPTATPNATPPLSTTAPSSPGRHDLGADGVIRLHIESPRDVDLVGGMDTSEARGMNLPICTSPCNAIVDGHYWQSLRFVGEGIPESSSFSTGDRKGEVVARVSPGSTTVLTTGTVLLGAAFAGGGGGTALFVASRNSRFGNSGGEAGGATIIGVSGAALVTGIVFRIIGRTTFTLSEGVATPNHAAARGLGVAF